MQDEEYLLIQYQVQYQRINEPLLVTICVPPKILAHSRTF
jgi:hypothetical protein